VKLPSGSRSSWKKALGLPAGLVLIASLLAAPSPPASAQVAAADPNGAGYWMVASDGGVFNFGDAGYFGSLGGTPLNKPITGILPTPSGQGYWMVASDGGVFAFGDAPYYGSAGALNLNKPIEDQGPDHRRVFRLHHPGEPDDQPRQPPEFELRDRSERCGLEHQLLLAGVRA
jgi:hypothetical protein